MALYEGKDQLSQRSASKNCIKVLRFKPERKSVTAIALKADSTTIQVVFYSYNALSSLNHYEMESIRNL